MKSRFRGSKSPICRVLRVNRKEMRATLRQKSPLNFRTSPNRGCVTVDVTVKHRHLNRHVTVVTVDVTVIYRHSTVTSESVTVDVTVVYRHTTVTIPSLNRHVTVVTVR